MIFRSTGKILKSQFILNSDQQFTTVLQITSHLSEKCFVWSITFGKTHRIFQYTIYDYIVKWFIKPHIIQIAYHNSKIIMIFISFKINF